MKKEKTPKKPEKKLDNLSREKIDGSKIAGGLSISFKAMETYTP